METEPTTFKGYRHWLAEELLKRKEKNQSYSLNAFSRSLNISPTTLSQVLSGKRRLGIKGAHKIIERCSLSPDESRLLLLSVYGELAPEPQGKVRLSNKRLSFQELELDKFQMISSWYHFAILSLGSIKNNKADPNWIAERLGISVRDAQAAFERLQRLKLVQRRGEGFYQSSEPLWVQTENSSTAIRKYHKENLEKAKEALDEPNTQLELFSSVTMVVDEDKLQKARSSIKEFRNKLTRLLSSRNKGSRVFTLAVQLFPISKEDKNND